jgi:O-antigen/teichoic acid export membrane protein
MWVFGLRITSRGLGFVRTIILARLLAPHDFGLLGIAILAISTLETLSQTGFQAALIQKKENIESYLDTAWTVSAIRGIILFLILFLSAPVIAKFFNSPQATLIIRIIAVSTLLSGFRNIGILFFQKELELPSYCEMSGPWFGEGLRAALSDCLCLIYFTHIDLMSGLIGMNLGNFSVLADGF